MSNRRFGPLPVVFAVLSVAIVCAVWWWWGVSGAGYFVRAWSPAAARPSLDQLSASGSLFGGVGALFTALALIGVAITAYLQNEQLNDAREAARKADAKAAEAKVQADEQYARQAFEPLFFKLIELMGTQTKSMMLDIGSSDLPVEAWFSVALNAFRSKAFSTSCVQLTPDYPGGWLERLTDTYLRFYHRNESQLGPYFRTLYRTLKLIDTSRLAEGERVEYANLVRGLMSRDELLLLMLNCCGSYGQKLKFNVETYGLLKHISRRDSKDTEIDRKIAGEAFAPTATMSHKERNSYWAAGNPRPWKTDDQR